jgi:hypothetical protein
VSPHSLSLPNPATLAALVLAACAGAVGCGGGGPPVGEVAGKVTFEGKPVCEGRVSFYSAKTGVAEDALLKQDGRYALKNPLPVGDYQVMVAPLIVRQRVDPKGPVVGEEKSAPDIPVKYRTIGSTDLRAKVKEGKNALDFDMKR